MVGFYRPDNRSQGVRDALRLQALIWENAGVRGGLITIDSLGFTVGKIFMANDSIPNSKFIYEGQVIVIPDV